MTDGDVQQIPMSSPDLTECELEAVTSVLKTPFLSIGPRIQEFEGAFARYVGARHAVAVSSGTAGLHLCVIAAGIADGQLVITTPFSFVASANVVLYERAIPVFVDVDPATGNLDPALVAKALRDLRTGGAAAAPWLPPALRGRVSPHPCLGGVLAVHAFGQPCDMDPINESAGAAGVPVIEDACEALGAEYNGTRVGRLGLASVFAFYPNKQMTTGEGGIIITDDDHCATLLRSLRNQGRDAGDSWLRHSRLGYNYRLDEMSAALGRAQLNRVDELLQRREEVAGWYSAALRDIADVATWPVVPTTTRMSWFVYVVQLAAGVDRERLSRLLVQRGVPTRPYFEPIHLQPFYSERFGYRSGAFPVAEQIGARTLALPFSGVMTKGQVEYVCRELVAGLKEQR